MKIFFFILITYFIVVPVTGKFYARHEAFDFDKVDPEILKNVTAYFDAGPKEKYAWPITENQTY